MKKPNLYHLLGRMESAGLLRIEVEPGARGPRRERLIYSVTAAGRREFLTLLRRALEEYEPIHVGVEVAAVLLDHLSAGEASTLLRNRLEAVRAHRKMVAVQLGEADPGTAADHVLLLIAAELAWLDRAIARLEPRDALVKDRNPRPAKTEARRRPRSRDAGRGRTISRAGACIRGD